MKEEFKKITDRLLEVNLGIKTLFGAEIPDAGDDVFAAFQAELEKLLIQKDLLIEKLKELKNRSKTGFAALKENDFRETWQEISKLEAENLETMQKLQAAISQKLAGNKAHSRVISSYKFKKDVQPRLFDDSL
jgi:hypothetical protein